MTTVPPTTDNSGQAGGDGPPAAQGVALMPAPIEPRPYVTVGLTTEPIDPSRVLPVAGPGAEVAGWGDDEGDGPDSVTPAGRELAVVGEPDTRAPERPPVYAGDARPGLLLAHTVDGEDIGIEVRHVESYHARRYVVIVLDGDATTQSGSTPVRYHRVDEVLDVVDPGDARAARQRLAVKRRRADQIAWQRWILDLAERNPDLPLPRFLRMGGSLGTLDELRRWAVELGCEAVESQSGSGDWYLEHRFGADGLDAPLELRLSHYAREAGR